MNRRYPAVIVKVATNSVVCVPQPIGRMNEPTPSRRLGSVSGHVLVPGGYSMMPVPSTRFVGNGAHDPCAPPYPLVEENISFSPVESVAMMSLVQVVAVELVTVTDGGSPALHDPA